MGESPLPRHVVLVDGTCVFCNKIVSFILAHDREGIFHFAHLQGDFAKSVLTRHGRDANDLDGIYIVMDAETEKERILVDGSASREIWPRLFRVAGIMRYVPLPMLNLGYRVFARYRYRLFGKYDACHIPSAEEKARILA